MERNAHRDEINSPETYNTNHRDRNGYCNHSLHRSRSIFNFPSNQHLFYPVRRVFMSLQTNWHRKLWQGFSCLLNCMCLVLHHILKHVDVNSLYFRYSNALLATLNARSFIGRGNVATSLPWDNAMISLSQNTGRQSASIPPFTDKTHMAEGSVSQKGFLTVSRVYPHPYQTSEKNISQGACHVSCSESTKVEKLCSESEVN
jgi:hypothetical protein